MVQVYKVRSYQQGNYSCYVEAVIDGQRKRKFFVSLKKARAWAELRNIELTNSGLNALSVSDEMRVEVQRALIALRPYGKSIAEAVETALPIFEATVLSRPVQNVVESLLVAKEAEGLSTRYLRDMKSRLGVFATRFRDRPISLIGTGDLKEWLRELRGSTVSKNNMRRLVSVLYSFAIESEWCDDNPARKIRAFAHKPSRIGILRPEEAKGLLNAAEPALKPFLAVGLFAGLRRSELSRLTPASVRMDSGLIEVEVTKTTGSARRFVRIRPNLKAWLESYKIGPMSEYRFNDLLRQARESAEMKVWPNNALRHSFCSYALAHEQKLQELTLEMGHTSPNTLFAHYRELVTPVDAAAYWAITP